MNINDYLDYKNITIAEFKAAIDKAERMFFTCIKRKDTIGALEATKTKFKLQNLLNKKTMDGGKNNYQGHKRT